MMQRQLPAKIVTISLLLLLVSNIVVVVDAYITNTALPEQRQVKWLKEMTFEVCESPPGELSDEMLEKTSHIIRGWATISKNKNGDNKKNVINNNNSHKKGYHQQQKKSKMNHHHYEHKSADATAAVSTAAAATNVRSVTTRINGTESAIAVESLMKRLIEEKREVKTEDYNCLLEGWATSGAGEAAAERCEQILNEMQYQYYSDSDMNVKPNLNSFKASLMAWKNVAMSWQQTQKNHHVLYVSSQNTNKNKKGEIYATRAQRILEWMIQLYDNEQNDCALPDADCFDTVLQMWSISGHIDAPKKTEKLLSAMERIYIATGNQSSKPQTGTFNAVLAAWASKVAKQQQQSSSSLPTATSKTKTSSSAARRGAERALEVLTFMERLAAEGDTDVAPNLVSYTIVMKALVRLGNDDSNQKAEALLERLIHSYTISSSNKNTKENNKRNNILLSPDTSLFNTVMGGWSKSKNNNGGLSSSFQRTRAILDKQIALYEILGCKKCRPDVFGFTSVINNCANVGKKTLNTGSNNNNKGIRQNQQKLNKFEAFQIALETFDQLRYYDRPNHVTYGAMMKACNLLLDKHSIAQKKHAQEIFNACIEDGCVGTMVLHHLHEIDPSIVNSWKKQKNNSKKQLQQKPKP